MSARDNYALDKMGEAVEAALDANWSPDEFRRNLREVWASVVNERAALSNRMAAGAFAGGDSR